MILNSRRNVKIVRPKLTTFALRCVKIERLTISAKEERTLPHVEDRTPWGERTTKYITRNTKKERKKERKKEEKRKEERSSYRELRRSTEKRSDVVCDECNEEDASRDAFVEEWSARRTGRLQEHAGRRKSGRRREKKRGVATSRKDAVVECGEYRRGSMEGKEERCRKAEGGRTSKGKERERDRDRGEGEREREREREKGKTDGVNCRRQGHRLYLAKTADTCLRRYTRVVL